jgi:hypothetical protein
MKSIGIGDNMAINLFAKNKKKDESKLDSVQQNEQKENSASKILLSDNVKRAEQAGELAEFLGKNNGITDIMLHEIDSSDLEVRMIAPAIAGGIARFKIGIEKRDEVEKLISGAGYKEIGVQGRGISIYKKA